MKRFIQVAKELNVAVNTLNDYQIKAGLKVSSPNDRITEEMEELLIQIHKGKVDPTKLVQKPPTSTQKLPKQFELFNPFEGEAPALALNQDIFNDRQEKELIVDDEKITTVFTDFEAFCVCRGLEDRHAMHIAREYFKNPNSSSDIKEAHIIAMKTLKKYGTKMISFILTLPPLPFKAVNAVQVFSELDKRRKTQEFPILRITYKNRKNTLEKIQISFYAEKTSHGRLRNDNVLVVKNRTTGKNVMKITRAGVVLPERNAREVATVLQMFVRFSQNTQQAIINYGLETGECSVCGRELTDPESIRRGIGPVCAGYV